MIARLTPWSRRAAGARARRDALPCRCPIRSELPQVMVEVFVHHDAPFLAVQPPEERVHLDRGLLRAPLAEPVDDAGESPLLRLEVLLFGHDERGIRGGAPAEGLLAEERRPDERPENPSDELLLARLVARGHLEGGRAVRHHLGGGHLSPLTLGPRLELCEPPENGLAVGGIEKAVHGESL